MKTIVNVTTRNMTNLVNLIWKMDKLFATFKVKNNLAPNTTKKIVKSTAEAAVRVKNTKLNILATLLSAA